MKTTKKGFTLIELIVVIAIIGVLAAILVPTMLGYVRKSKISSANSAASSVYKAINSALTELDEEGIDVGGDYILTYTAGTNGAAGSWSDIGGKPSGFTVGGKDKFAQKVSNFFSDIVKMKKVKAAVSGGSCIALASRQDSTYNGTYPAGVVTSDTFETYKGDGNFEVAYGAALEKADYKVGNSGFEKSGV